MEVNSDTILPQQKEKAEVNNLNLHRKLLQEEQ